MLEMRENNVQSLNNLFNLNCDVVLSDIWKQKTIEKTEEKEETEE